jgi:ferrous iron transport protein A
MGIVPGVRIEVIRCAPMGDPVELKLREYLLTLRKTEADSVIVSKEVPQ